MSKFVVIAAASLSVAGCSSVEMIDGTSALSFSETCNVQIYQTRKQAEKLGEIEELCIISGTSSGSFVHSIAVAINKHKGKACRCGATKAYVESRQESGWNLATVTLVAFRVVSANNAQTAR
jgi:hypothetical protein